MAVWCCIARTREKLSPSDAKRHVTDMAPYFDNPTLRSDWLMHKAEDDSSSDSSSDEADENEKTLPGLVSLQSLLETSGRSDLFPALEALRRKFKRAYSMIAKTRKKAPPPPAFCPIYGMITQGIQEVKGTGSMHDLSQTKKQGQKAVGDREGGGQANAEDDDPDKLVDGHQDKAPHKVKGADMLCQEYLSGLDIRLPRSPKKKKALPPASLDSDLNSPTSLTMTTSSPAPRSPFEFKVPTTPTTTTSFAPMLSLVSQSQGSSRQSTSLKRSSDSSGCPEDEDESPNAHEVKRARKEQTQ
jgi:hypothetical protein